MPTLYGHRWRKERARFLSKHPICVYCERDGKVEVATVVDHIKPHNGDRHLFWDQGNWQPMCKQHHDATKAREENSGKAVGCDERGIPLGGWS